MAIGCLQGVVAEAAVAVAEPAVAEEEEEAAAAEEEEPARRLRSRPRSTRCVTCSRPCRRQPRQPDRCVSRQVSRWRTPFRSSASSADRRDRPRSPELDVVGRGPP